MISSDLGERHDHPKDEVLKNLHEHDVPISWTAGHGTTRVDLDEALSTEPTTDLETTNSADLTALKHYCRENEISPDEVQTLAPTHLPEETPEWVTDAAPMIARSPEEIVDAAITNAETTEDVSQTLKDAHSANKHLYFAIKNDRTEHVTTETTVRENRQRRDTAERNHAAAQPSFRDRVESAFPFVSDPDLPEYDGPAPEEIEGPFTEEAIAEAVTDSRTAETIRDDPWSEESPPDYLLTAEEHANTAVENAETAAELLTRLRDTPGAHSDVMNAIETPETHIPDGLLSNEQDNTKAISQGMNHNRDQGRGVSQ